MSKYEATGDFSEGFAIVSANNKYGFIDKTGKEITAIDYDFVNDFSESLAAVGRDGKYGFIDKIGKEIIPIQFGSIYPYSEEGEQKKYGFYNGKTKVWLDGREFYIDKTGNEIK